MRSTYWPLTVKPVVAHRAPSRESGYVVPMNRSSGDNGKAATAEAAERAQADYFRCLLVERRAEIDIAIVKILAAAPRRDSQSAVGEARGLGRVVHNAERERREVDRMITALDRRFPPADPAMSPRTPSQPDEIIHPDGRSLLSISQKRRPANTSGRRSQRKVG